MTSKENKSDAETDVKKTQNSDNDQQQEILVLEVESVTVIEDGKHEGLIVGVYHRTVPFGYIDVSIKEKVTEAELKVGYSAKITHGTGLGKLLLAMGVKLDVGDKIDLNSELLGREVEFITSNEETDKGVFARVLRGTVKPLK